MSLQEDEYKRQVVLSKLKNLENACGRMFNRKRVL